MATGISEILARLKGKVSVLAERYQAVRIQRDEARQRCSELQDRLETVQTELQQLRTENEYLRISHKIAPTPEDVRQSQAVIAGLVKKIDKCISQLRND